jgi:hypothetical protein
MKKAFIILTLCVFLAFLLSNALAIERVSKKDTAASKEQKEEATPAPAPEKKESIPPEKQVIKPEPGAEQPREGEVKKPQKEREEGISRILRGSRKGLKEEGKDKYDYFIDKNGNGIDDRLEQQGKTEKKPEERKAPPEKKERRGR